MTTLLALVLAATASAAPVTLHHQARLVDSAGTPISGTHDVDVALWSTDDLGQTTPVWLGEYTQVSVDAGYINLALGADGSLDSGLFVGQDLWVSLRVDDADVGARQRLASVPTAALSHGVQLSEVATCNAAAAGTLRYTDRGEFEGCNGAAWVPLGAQPGSEVFPGVTCKDILSRRPTAVDGVYFVNAGTTDTAEQVFCDMSDGGWTLIGKASDGSAANYGTVFPAGNSNRGVSAYLDRSAESGAYASRLAGAWWASAGFTEVRVEIWRGGAIDKTLTFNAASASNTSWFSMPTLTGVTGWNDLPYGTYNAFAMSTGDGNYIRDFYISQQHNGCPEDRGWLVLPASNSCTDWHNPSVGRILYSTTTGFIDWTDGAAISSNAAYADVMVILAR